VIYQEEGNVGVLDGVFALIGAIVTHVPTTRREREADQLRRRHERYAAILEQLVPFTLPMGPT
jgi:hypothetical protein